MFQTMELSLYSNRSQYANIYKASVHLVKSVDMIHSGAETEADAITLITNSDVLISNLLTVESYFKKRFTGFFKVTFNVIY